MAKIYPQVAQASDHLLSSVPAGLTTSRQETFTIWMKSLIFNSKGCTVYDSTGQIVYRVDNYNCKCSNEVYLMDSAGKVLFDIRRKKFKPLRFWEGYRSLNETVNDKDNKNPAFQVRKNFGIFRGDSMCEVAVWLDQDQPCQHYQIKTCPDKSTFKIKNKLGNLIAEVKRKQSKCGISLGEDVLTMVVQPHTDHSLIMGLIVVYSLINYKM